MSLRRSADYHPGVAMSNERNRLVEICKARGHTVNVACQRNFRGQIAIAESKSSQCGRNDIVSTCFEDRRQ